ncbi:MAG: hypothetical protein ACE5GN_04625, partial [Waddliaceae bacterium]
VASLKYDVPFFKEEILQSKNVKAPSLDQAVEAYISGYEERSDRRLNRKRLLWYQMWYEIFYVSLMLKKDRFDLCSFNYAICLLVELRGKFLKIKSMTF